MTANSQLRIAFGHVVGGQFAPLHRHLTETGLAQSWLLCSKEYWEEHKSDIPNLIPHQFTRSNWSEMRRVDCANTISSAFVRELAELHVSQRLDLYLGHVVFGSPLLMFNRLNCAVMTYAEFPCFRKHGWDSQFPPTEAERELDDNFEMLTSYCVLRSAQSIVPSEYARSLFSKDLQPKITAQMEGLDLGGIRKIAPRDRSDFRIGFLARDISAAKGFGEFVRIAVEISKRTDNVEFIVIGGGNTPYGFEARRLRASSSGSEQTYATHVLKSEGAPLDRFVFKGLVPHARLSDEIAEIDLFLYPLQFGSGNWGLVELLARGAIVLASNRCYLPEIIEDGVNGFLLEYADTDAWVNTTLRLLADSQLRGTVSERARTAAQAYSIAAVAPKYVEILRRAVRGRLENPSPKRSAALSHRAAVPSH